MRKLIYVFLFLISKYSYSISTQEVHDLLYQKKYSEAIPLLKNGINQYTINYVIIGNCYTELELYDSALHYYSLAGLYLTDNESKAQILINLSHLYNKNGEYSSAISTIKLVFDLNTPQYIQTRAFINYASYLHSSNQLNESLKIYDTIINYMNIENEYYSFIYQMLGDIYLSKSDTLATLSNYDKALYYINKGIYQNKNIPYLYLSIANIYIGKKQFGKALNYIDKSEIYCLKDIENNLINLVQTFNTKSVWYYRQNMLKEALQYSNMALHYLTDNKIFIDVYENRADIFNEINNTDSALYYYQKAINMHHITWKQFLTSRDKLLFNQHGADLYTKAIKCAYTAYTKNNTPDLLFRLTEQSRYSVLFNELENSSVLTLPQVQQKMKPGEAFLSYTLLTDQLISFFISKDKIKCINTPVDTIFLLQLDNIIKSLEWDFLPDYTGEFKRFINSSYYLYEKLIVPFKDEIANKKLRVVANNKLELLPLDVLIKEKPVVGNEVKPKEYTRLKYMIYDNVITYCENVSMYFSPVENNKKLKIGFFLPVYNRTPGFIDLVANKKLAFKLHKLYGADVYMGKEATKKNFEKQADKYQMLYIASHGLFDTVNFNNFIAMSPDSDMFLYQDEISNLKLSNDIVIIPSCYANTGKIIQGEGLLSVTRAFRRAGAKSVIANRWINGDMEFAYLAGKFFKYLSWGKTPDVALQKAKIDMIAVYEPGIDWHPSYWGNNVLVGSVVNVHVYNRRHILLVATSLIMLVTAFIYIKNTFRN